ncbi:MAG: agmatinase [Pseudomonadota bacterium]
MTTKPTDTAFTADDLYTQSKDPTFAGALSFMRRKYTRDLTGVDAVVWGIPFDAATSNRPGTRFGPQGVRRASAGMDNDPQYPFGSRIFDELATIDYGDCTFDYGYNAEVPAQIEEQAAAILNADSDPYLLSIGGDHFVTYPLLKAHAEKHGRLSLVQFDAHQDTWDDDGERVDHGTFITRAVKEGIIDPDTSIQIGIRTHAPQDYGIEIIDALAFHGMGPKEAAKRVYDRTNGTNVYLTFDIDCLDPAFAPGTGTPVVGGLSSAQALMTLRHLKNLQIVGSDVVEVSPAYDHADITSNAGATVAMYMLGTLWERRRPSLNPPPAQLESPKS